jgi:hypothetical protein
MQSCPPQRESGSALKRSLYGGVITEKAYAAKRKAVVARKLNAKPAQNLDPSGQHSFAAGFIDRRMRGVDHGDAESLATGSNCRSQSGWSAADHQDVAHYLPDW